MNTRQKLHQIILQELLEHFQNQAASGLTVKDWCSQNDILIRTYNYLSLFYDHLHELIYDSKVIHADETPIKVMRIDDQKRKENPNVVNEFDDLPVANRQKLRQTKLKEKVDAYFEYVKSKYDQVAHNSTIGKALKYSINQEKYLRVFLTDGNVPTDNNAAEQAIRPFTIGRKNFVLMATDNGAKAYAMLYGLVKTAKANEINTYKDFELLLTEIPKHMQDHNLAFIDDLLPWSPRVQKKSPSKFKIS